MEHPLSLLQTTPTQGMRYFLFLITIFSIQPIHAETYTVEPKPFKVETTLDAVFLPTEFASIRIDPEEWTDFTITSLVSHGTQVKKGIRLIDIDSRTLDEEIASLEKSIELGALNLAKAQQQLEQLKITTPLSLEKHARHERETNENLEHHLATGQPLQIENIKRNVTRAEFYLASQQEELEQLLKMYEEDDKTEETEEMILKRARYYVDRAKFGLESARQEAEWELKTHVPRQLESKKLAAKNARIANTAAQKELPRDLQIKQQETDKAAKDHQENIDKLAKLKSDRAMMDIVSPADGTVYYGEIKHGAWSASAVEKILLEGGKLRAHTTLMTIIPSNASLKLYALAAEEKLAGISHGANGYATIKQHPHKSFPVSISGLARYPSAKGKFLTTIEPALPEEMPVVTGIKANVTIITHSMDQALVIPLDYLENTDDGGYCVKVKLADGKTDKRKVLVGASNEKSAVITQGLEKSQVIVK